MVHRTQSEIREQILEMNPYDFEELVGEVWEENGHEVTVRKGSGDEAIDIVATKEPTYKQENGRILIQVKRWAKDNKISSDNVRYYKTLYPQESNVDSVIIVTSGEFTDPAVDLAEKLDVKAINGEEISKKISKCSNISLYEYFNDEIKDKSQKNRTRTNDEIKDKSQKNRTRTSIVSAPISSDPYKYSHMSKQERYNHASMSSSSEHDFKKCPVCGFFDYQTSDNELNCPECESSLEKVQEKSEISRWRGVAGDAKGKIGTTDEWKHHYQTLKSESSNAEVNTQSQSEVATEKDHVKFDKFESENLNALGQIVSILVVCTFGFISIIAILGIIYFFWYFFRAIITGLILISL